MEDKIKIIDLICQHHPSYGTEKGWSEYTGGMKDSGQWFFRKMLDVPLQELVDFLNFLIAEERKPTIEETLTEEQKIKSKIIIPDGHGGWYTQLGKEQLEDWVRKQELNLFGIATKNSGDETK